MITFSQSNQQIAAALAKAWGSIETPKHNTSVIVKTNVGGSYEFSYTDLDGIFEAVKGVYKQHGIAVVQSAHTYITDAGQAIVAVVTMLLHESGEWARSEPLQVPAAQKMQDLGGQITYMKRYSLSAMLGIATEKDDDANGVSGNAVEYKPRKLSEAQVKRLFAIANNKGFSMADVKKVVVERYKKTNAEDLTKQEYDELVSRLEAAKKGAN